MLISRNMQYVEKADNRTGGVGTETQIISPEIYNKTEQTKFLPIIFGRGNNDAVLKPAYLKGTLHFDLSKEESYETEYQRLVKTLYGVETYKKPELGMKPDWVDKRVDFKTAKRITKYEEIKKKPIENDRRIAAKEIVNQLKNTLLSYEFENDESSSVQMYDELRDIRDDYIALMNVSPYASACISFLSDSFESIFLELKDMPRAVETIMKRTLIHELFIYLVAICYKNGLFEELGHLLNRSYYIGEYENEFGNYRIFYTNNDYLDKAICKKDNKNYFSGTANYWIETLDVNTDYSGLL